MINWLHYYLPNRLLFSLGYLHIYWYGFFITVGILLAIVIAVWLGQKYNLFKDKIIDLAFWIIIFGIIGARLYHVGLEWKYYLEYPLQILMPWKGGMAIHGGIIVGLLVVYYFSKKQKIDFWLLTAIFVPGLALAQAIGRWGNYFNQELFGLPTKLPWGIPIDVAHRPVQYLTEKFFHPTFLYASLGNFIIFLILLALHFYFLKNKKRINPNFFLITLSYLILYSLLRFGLEFIRIDHTLLFFGWRWPQIISILIILLALLALFFKKNKKIKKYFSL